MNNVQRCLCHFYTWMRHSKQTATLLLTKRYDNFDTSTSAKGYARVCTNCACAIVVLGILLAQARPTMPCIRLVIGASVSEPPSSDANGTVSYIYILCVVRRAAYPKLIQFNARNVYKIRIVQTPHVLQWSRTAILQQESPSHQGIEKTDCSVEENERELVVPLKPRNRERNG